MSGHLKAAIAVVVLGVAAVIAWRFVEPMLAEAQKAKVSDAGNRKGSVRIAVDSWVGYFPLCSREMKQRLHRAGYALECTDDSADYAARFGALDKGGYDFAAATVDSYLLNGERFDFPGPIVAVLDESKGGDAIVSWQDRAATLEALKTDATLTVAYTPDSPSEHLMKAVATHFEVPLLRSASNLVAADGSEDALAKLADREVDVAVLWEPEVSKALQRNGIVRLLDTSETRQLIVDILIASRETAASKPDMVLTTLRAHFETLKHYRDQNHALVSDIEDRYGVSADTASALLQGVAWASLSDNASRWYGVAGHAFHGAPGGGAPGGAPSRRTDALAHTIEAAASILVAHGDFAASPVPGGDPYRLISSAAVKELYDRFAYVGGFTTALAGNAASAFPALSDREWQRLQEVGSLKTRKVSFASGNAELTDDGKRLVDQVAADLVHYPQFRIEVRGHTGLRGDAGANQELSRNRADAVLRYLVAQHRIASSRLRAVGFGAARPLPRLPGESNRAYGYRLPRVEVALVRESI